MKKFLMIVLMGFSLVSSFAHATDLGDLTPKMKQQLAKDWLFKAALQSARKKYKHCEPYQSTWSAYKADRFENNADRTILITYSCDQADSVDVTALYNSHTREISNVSVSYRPCSSDMCGP